MNVILYIWIMTNFKDKTILILDDDSSILFSLDLLLEPLFNRVITSSISDQVLNNIEDFEVDILIMDMNYTKGLYDGEEGKYILKKIRKTYPFLPIIVMTAYSEVNLAVECMKLGATDFINKPWQNNELLIRLKQGLNTSHHLYHLNQMKNVTMSALNIDEDLGMVGDSKAVQDIRKTILKVAKTDANVIILGENGTGKELVAKALHQYSLRKAQAFVKIDLGSVSSSLFESELFGSKKGAYTGSSSDKIGRIALANKGSLFLDELGNLQLDLQSKLLSVLQNREIIPVGSSKSEKIDVRVISATNLDPKTLRNETIFRRDLLYRVNTIEIVLPPLRERKSDIPLLLSHFLDKFKLKHNKLGLKLNAKFIEEAKAYKWPGNVRELEHVMERVVILSDDIDIQWQSYLTESDSENDLLDSLNLETMEKKLILKALKINAGNISKTAKDLGLTRPALYRRLEKFDL